MTFLKSMFRKRPDPRESLRPLWHRVVELSRDPALYRDDGVADSVAGRFDMISAILALVLLRMERAGDMAVESVLLTELFVADMDGQLRETGVGDVMVGKHLGKLMSVLGGRLGAIRNALAEGGETELAAALARNITLADEGSDTLSLARRLRQFYDQLGSLDDEAVVAGRFAL
jgi:cytochrome b pre-mRNA-processing protein 3